MGKGGKAEVHNSLRCSPPDLDMLALTSLAAAAFNGPVVSKPTFRQSVSMTAITPGDIGTTKPLGVYDPLGLMTKMPDKYRRWQEMEIKHGRFAMAAGIRWPGYLSFAEDIKFS